MATTETAAASEEVKEDEVANNKAVVETEAEVRHLEDKCSKHHIQMHRYGMYV